MKIAIMISGGGTNMSALLSGMQSGDINADPVLVLSNRPNAGGLTKANSIGVPTQAIDHTLFSDRSSHDAALHESLVAAGAELVCLAGYMRIFSDEFVSNWAGRMINIHPSLLPSFRGLHTHRRALEAGVAVHGCSVHEVTAELDEGPILGQAIVRTDPNDTPETLAVRVLKQEHLLYPKVLSRYIAGERKPLLLNGLDD